MTDACRRAIRHQPQPAPQRDHEYEAWLDALDAMQDDTQPAAPAPRQYTLADARRERSDYDRFASDFARRHPHVTRSHLTHKKKDW